MPDLSGAIDELELQLAAGLQWNAASAGIDEGDSRILTSEFNGRYMRLSCANGVVLMEMIP